MDTCSSHFQVNVPLPRLQELGGSRQLIGQGRIPQLFSDDLSTSSSSGKLQAPSLETWRLWGVQHISQALSFLPWPKVCRRLSHVCTFLNICSSTSGAYLKAVAPLKVTPLWQKMMVRWQFRRKCTLPHACGGQKEGTGLSRSGVTHGCIGLM